MSAAVFDNSATPVMEQVADEAIVGVVNPGQRSGASSAMMPRLELLRACYGGTETMRQMGDTFLPCSKNEEPTRYLSRLNNTFCLNKLREAVDSASAKPFQNLVTLTGIPEDDELNAWMWDADLKGHHLHVVGHRYFNEAVLTGLSHILVDHPSTLDLPNLAVQNTIKPRPYMKTIKAEDLLACYTTQVGGETRVMHARISSSRTDFNTQTFAEIIVDQIYVIEPGVCQLWERPRPQISQAINYLGTTGSILTPRPFPLRYLSSPVNGLVGGAWALKAEKRISIDQVPLTTMTAGDEEADLQVRPVFQDLAYKQVEHWISSSEQRNILSASRFPMLAASGIQVEESTDQDNPNPNQGFSIGPWKILTTPDPQGRWYYVEPHCYSITAGATDMQNIEMHMDMMALNPLMSTNRQYVPQNERSLAETRVNSVIHDLAIGCKDSLEQAVRFMGMWTKRDYSKVGVGLNFNFSGTDERSKLIDSVLKSVAVGTLSREGALTELRRLKLFNDDFDIKLELARQSVVQEKATFAVTEDGAGTPANDPEGRGGVDPTKAAHDAATKAAALAASHISKEDRDFPKGQMRPTRQI